LQSRFERAASVHGSLWSGTTAPIRQNKRGKPVWPEPFQIPGGVTATILRADNYLTEIFEESIRTVRSSKPVERKSRSSGFIGSAVTAVRHSADTGELTSQFTTFIINV
jgi:hypothetical protein